MQMWFQCQGNCCVLIFFCKQSSLASIVPVAHLTNLSAPQLRVNVQRHPVLKGKKQTNNQTPLPEEAKCPEWELKGTGAAPGERRRTQRSRGKLIRRLYRRKIQSAGRERGKGRKPRWGRGDRWDIEINGQWQRGSESQIRNSRSLK